LPAIGPITVDSFVRSPANYPPTTVDASISLERIREAAHVVDPVFLHSPQFNCEPLSRELGVTTLLKVETTNPIRTFKGRGADYLLQRLGDDKTRIVCASAGNFGQGMAYASRKRGRKLTVFAARNANPLKIARMRALGATVKLDGDDFDAAKDAARRYAEDRRLQFVEDGLLGAIAEGAGTIAVELVSDKAPLDAVFVPLGNGSLVNGVGTWLRRHSPGTRVVAVCARSAPSMALSWKSRKPIIAESTTIADGIAVRVPVPEAVGFTAGTVDDVALVSDEEMLSAMHMLHLHAGLVVEPSGAAGVAAIAQRARELSGQRVAAILTGGNLTEQQVREWLS
jgi:threonine dehydratase